MFQKRYYTKQMVGVFIFFIIVPIVVVDFFRATIASKKAKQQGWGCSFAYKNYKLLCIAYF